MSRQDPDPDAPRPRARLRSTARRERRSSGGIVIPATAAMGGRRLAWSRVAAVGPHVRAVEVGDRVLFDPEDKAEVEVNGETYVADARARHPRGRRRAARRQPDRPLPLTGQRARTSYGDQRPACRQRRTPRRRRAVGDAGEHHVEQAVPARHPVRERREEQGAGDEPGSSVSRRATRASTVATKAMAKPTTKPTAVGLRRPTRERSDVLIAPA